MKNNNRQKELIQEFKLSIKNDEFKPTFDKTYGTKYKGAINNIHFYLYAVIRLSNINKAFHKPEEFSHNWKVLKMIGESDNYGYLLTTLKKIFPSITREDISFFINNYAENKTKSGE
jgi:hypothetical protein